MSPTYQSLAVPDLVGEANLPKMSVLKKLASSGTVRNSHDITRQAVCRRQLHMPRSSLAGMLQHKWFDNLTVQQMLRCEGYGRCWWAQPSAAELPDQDALALRQDRQRQLHIRGLMPHVMLSLTCFQTAADDQSGAAVREANGEAKEALQESGNMSSGCNLVQMND